MAIRYYDELLAEKIKRWIPENSILRVLKPDESKRLFETKADDTNDAPFKLPFVALSRSNDIELLSNIKTLRSYAGIKLYGDSKVSTNFNAIPIKVEYRFDIYTKTMEEGDEYLRSFLFKLINNPKMIITIPYNGTNIEHIVYLRVLDTVSDTSDISEHLYSGQFTRWTIQIELQDAYLFNIPYRKNWKLDGILFEDTSDTNIGYDEKPNPDGSFEAVVEVTSDLDKSYNETPNPDGSLEEKL